MSLLSINGLGQSLPSICVYFLCVSCALGTREGLAGCLNVKSYRKAQNILQYSPAHQSEREWCGNHCRLLFSIWTSFWKVCNCISITNNDRRPPIFQMAANAHTGRSPTRGEFLIPFYTKPERSPTICYQAVRCYDYIFLHLKLKLHSNDWWTSSGVLWSSVYEQDFKLLSEWGNHCARF